MRKRDEPATNYKQEYRPLDTKDRQNTAAICPLSEITTIACSLTVPYPPAHLIVCSVQMGDAAMPTRRPPGRPKGSKDRRPRQRKPQPDSEAAESGDDDDGEGAPHGSVDTDAASERPPAYGAFVTRSLGAPP